LLLLGSALIADHHWNSKYWTNKRLSKELYVLGAELRRILKTLFVLKAELF